jgi:hypothetical protein
MVRNNYRIIGAAALFAAVGFVFPPSLPASGPQSVTGENASAVGIERVLMPDHPASPC